MKKIADYYIYFHFHVGLAAVALYFLYARSINRSPGAVYPVFLFVSTVGYYTFLRLLHINSLRSKIKHFYEKNFIPALLITALSGIVATVIFFLFFKKEIWFFLPALLLALFYNLKISGGRIMGLRKIGVLKIITIAAVWSIMVVLIPFIGGGQINVPLMFLHAFLFVLLWTLPFDIRDLSLDSSSLQTVPQIFTGKILYVIFFLWILYTAVTLRLYSKGMDVYITAAFISAGLFSVAASYYSGRLKDNYFFTAFWVEGIPVWILLIYSVFKILT